MRWVQPARRPRVRRKVAVATLAGFPKVSFGLGWLLFFEKLLLFFGCRCFFSEKLTSFFWVGGSATFPISEKPTLNLLVWLLVHHFWFFLPEGCPKVAYRLFLAAVLGVGWVLPWCTAATSTERPRVRLERGQEHFLHDGPLGMCRAICRARFGW